jgi:hypothetical protein
MFALSGRRLGSAVFDLRPVEANLDPSQRLHPFDGSKFNRYDGRRINPPTKYFMPKTSRSKALSRPIEHHIYVIRGRKVMLDRDLAALYGVSTDALNQAVRRNRERFPDDFMFTLDRKESENLKSQTVISSWGGRRKPPSAFTEHGVARTPIGDRQA